MKILNSKILQENILRRSEELIKTGHIGACEVIVMQNGEKILHESYGCDKGRMYRLASMTKPVTAAAVLSEVQNGRLSLDDKVSKYISGFADMYIGQLDENGRVILKEKANREITVAMLLDHTSGMMSDAVGIGMAQEAAMTDSDRYDLESTVRYYKHAYLSFQPGESAFYSPVAAFNIAARIVELTSGMSFDKYIEKYITGPLGVSDITFVPSEAQWVRMASMHTFDGSRTGIDNMPRILFDGCPPTCYYGGAGLAGSAEAYSAFAEMLLNEGRYNGREILRPEMVHLLKKPHVPMGGNPEDAQWWGLGVRVIVKDSIIPAGSFGWSGAYGTHFWVDTANRVTAVYMKNSRYDGGSGAQTAVWFEQDVVNSFEG